MDDRFEAIARGLIRTERSHRERQTLAALDRVTQEFEMKRALGHGRYPVMLDVEGAREYESRAERWLAIVRNMVSETQLTWTPERAREIQHLLETELLNDWEELVGMLRQRRQDQEPRLVEMDKAKNRARVHLSHQFELLVYAEDRTRVPIAEQLTAPRYTPVGASLRKARGLLDGTAPDYNNAAKEAVSAVEQLARTVIGKPNLTLGEAIKDLRKSSQIPERLLNSIEEIWIWASQTPGVRHGSASTPQVDLATARFVVAQAEAAIALLLASDET